jgi:hypothetical protein
MHWIARSFDWRTLALVSALRARITQREMQAPLPTLSLLHELLGFRLSGVTLNQRPDGK